MNIEEYQKSIDKLIKSEAPQVEAVDLMDAINQDVSHANELQKKIDELTEKNKKLTESNNKLYSRIFLTEQGKNETEEKQKEEKEETPDEVFTELFNKRFYGGKK